MSFSKLAFMSRAIPEAKDLTFAERVTLMAIAGATDITGRNARISYAKIAEKTGMSPATMEDHVPHLIEAGYIIQQSRGNSVTHQANVYRLKGTEPTEGETALKGAQKATDATGRTITPATATQPSASKPEAPVGTSEAIPCRICDKPVTADDAYNPPDTPNIWHRTCFRDRYPTLTMKPEDCHL